MLALLFLTLPCVSPRNPVELFESALISNDIFQNHSFEMYSIDGRTHISRCGMQEAFNSLALRLGAEIEDNGDLQDPGITIEGSY